MTPDEKHIKRINKYLVQINSIYNELVREIALIAVKLKVSDKLFRFKDYQRITKQVNDSLQNYQDRLISSIKVYSEYEWDYGLAKVDDELKGQLLKVKGKVIPEAYDTKMREISKQSQNKKAFEAFQ